MMGMNVRGIDIGLWLGKDGINWGMEKYRKVRMLKLFWGLEIVWSWCIVRWVWVWGE